MAESSEASKSYEAQRHCHVVKRDDFDGYGFNLHAEKGKPGQYIGKVDDNSPAEHAGLREGDRIITVNDINIGNETHKQVVQRIKAIASEVRLMVVDSRIEVSKNNEIIQSNDKPASPVSSEKSNTISSVESKPSETPSPAPHSSDNSPVPEVKHVSNNNNVINTNNNNTSSNNNSHSKPQNGDLVNEVDGKVSNTSPLKVMEEPAKPTLESPTPEPQISNNKTNSEGLHLPMTVAEMRAQLAAKKKRNAKTDTAYDLRQKYEIIQKL